MAEKKDATDSDAKRFGLLVRERRLARGWSQEALAAKAFANEDRKGYVSRIENGKIPNITRETVKTVAQALEINPEAIPPALRWPEVSAAIQSDVERLVAAESERAREFGIKEGMLIALARRYAVGGPGDFDAALAGLERALEVARDEREKGRLSSNVAEALDAVIARIDALNEEGAFDEGQAALDAELAALDEEDARRKAARARLYEKGVAQSILTRSAANACRFVLAGFDLEAPTDPEERYQALRAIFIDWYQRGLEKGLNFDLEVAILLAREAVRRADTMDRRSAMRTNLGTALTRLGDRERGVARLEEAVQAYRDALEERTRERVPLDWAMTQMNLGLALTRLGERESGVARLEEAVQAYRNALQEFTRERVPLDWAATQNNLGNALRSLGARESGVARLEEAVQAYRDALKERTRGRVPLDWAATQNNLGIALRSLAERDSGVARLEEAVQAYRNALQEHTRERIPLQWAVTQNNLGAALQSLGERDSGVARLEEAVQAYRDALQERTRERVPLDWAGTQNNLGAALRSLGDRESGVARLEEAIQAYRDALQEFTRERVPLQWAITQNNLGNALASLGERESGVARLEEAVQAYRDALKERTRERVPLQWAATQMNLGEALTALSRKTGDLSTLADALSRLDAASLLFHEAEHGPGVEEVTKQLETARALQKELAAPGAD